MGWVSASNAGAQSAGVWQAVVAALSAVRASPAEEGAQHGIEQVGDGDPLAVRAMGGEQACSQRFFQADTAREHIESVIKIAEFDHEVGFLVGGNAPAAAVLFEGDRTAEAIDVDRERETWSKHERFVRDRGGNLWSCLHESGQESHHRVHVGLLVKGALGMRLRGFGDRGIDLRTHDSSLVSSDRLQMVRLSNYFTPLLGLELRNC